jgi:PAS domain-containing protein
LQVNGVTFFTLDDPSLAALPAVFVCDTAGVVRQFNRRAADLWGGELEPGATTEQLCSAGALDQDLVGETLRTGVPSRDQEVVLTRPDSSRVPVLLDVDPIRDERGQVLGAVNVVREPPPQPGQPRSEEEIEALARDALLLSSIRDSVIMTDLSGVVNYWNEGTTRLFGWTAREMLGRSLMERLPAAIRDDIRVRFTCW